MCGKDEFMHDVRDAELQAQNLDDALARLSRAMGNPAFSLAPHRLVGSALVTLAAERFEAISANNRRMLDGLEQADAARAGVHVREERVADAPVEATRVPFSAFTYEQLDEIFKYHAPNEDQKERYMVIRATARHFAGVILECTPAGADQSAAIRKLREAVMTANASIALEASR